MSVVYSQPWVSKFLNRLVQNFERYKEQKKEFYLEKFKSIGLDFPNPDYQPRFHQLVLIYLSIKYKALMLLVDLGLGKAQPLDAKILTPRGWKLMGELKIGDEIISGNGKLTKIVQIFPQGKKEIFKVTFSDGAQTECCEEHLWLTQSSCDRTNERQKRKTSGIPTIRSLKEMKNSLIYGGMKNYSIPLLKNIQFSYKKVIIHPYIFGCLLGDGGLSGGAVNFTNTDKDILSIICKNLLPGYKLSRQGNSITFGIVKNIKNRTIPNQYLKTIKKFKLNVPSNKKFIPNIYKFNNRKTRLQCLQGLLDTDGYISKNGDTIQFTSTSKQLAKDTQFLVNSLGGTAVLHSKISTFTYLGIKKNGKRAYTLTLRVPDSLIPFLCKRKSIRRRLNIKYKPIRFISKIESVGFKESQCILVDDPSHLYVTDDCIVTHNTSVMLHTIKGLQLREKQPLKALVLVPTLLLINEWDKEAPKHRPDLKFVNMRDNKKSVRWDQIRKGDGDVYCINYDGLAAMVTELKPQPHSRKRARVINPQLMTELVNNFSIVVYDEITAVKNPKSLLFKICREFTKSIPYRYGLTGTPFGRNLEDLWGEFFVVDGGGSLGRSKYLYDQVFFDIKPNFWGGVEKKFRNELMPGLKRLMYNTAIRYQQEECAELPPINYSNVPIGMPEEMKPFYKTQHDKIVQTFKGRIVTFLSVEQLWVQTREICSNFLNVKDKTTGETITINIPGPAKMERLMQLVEALPEAHKMVIFHEFILSGIKMKEEIEKAGYKCVHIYGGTKNREDLLKQFEEDPETNILIVNSQIGALGLNLQHASYIVFYEIPVDSITYQQAVARCHRTGQTKPVFVYNLFLSGSVEETILKGIKEGKNLRKHLLDDPKSVLKAVLPNGKI